MTHIVLPIMLDGLPSCGNKDNQTLTDATASLTACNDLAEAFDPDTSVLIIRATLNLGTPLISIRGRRLPDIGQALGKGCRTWLY